MVRYNRNFTTKLMSLDILNIDRFYYHDLQDRAFIAQRSAVSVNIPDIVIKKINSITKKATFKKISVLESLLQKTPKAFEFNVIDKDSIYIENCRSLKGGQIDEILEDFPLLFPIAMNKHVTEDQLNYFLSMYPAYIMCIDDPTALNVITCIRTNKEKYSDMVYYFNYHSSYEEIMEKHGKEIEREINRSKLLYGI